MVGLIEWRAKEMKHRKVAIYAVGIILVLYLGLCLIPLKWCMKLIDSKRKSSNIEEIGDQTFEQGINSSIYYSSDTTDCFLYKIIEIKTNEPWHAKIFMEEDHFGKGNLKLSRLYECRISWGLTIKNIQNLYTYTRDSLLLPNDQILELQGYKHLTEAQADSVVLSWR